MFMCSITHGERVSSIVSVILLFLNALCGLLFLQTLRSAQRYRTIDKFFLLQALLNCGILIPSAAKSVIVAKHHFVPHAHHYYFYITIMFWCSSLTKLSNVSICFVSMYQAYTISTRRIKNRTQQPRSWRSRHYFACTLMTMVVFTILLSIPEYASLRKPYTNDTIHEDISIEKQLYILRLLAMYIHGIGFNILPNILVVVSIPVTVRGLFLAKQQQQRAFSIADNSSISLKLPSESASARSESLNPSSTISLSTCERQRCNSELVVVVGLDDNAEENLRQIHSSPNLNEASPPASKKHSGHSLILAPLQVNRSRLLVAIMLSYTVTHLPLGILSILTIHYPHIQMFYSTCQPFTNNIATINNTLCLIAYCCATSSFRARVRLVSSRLFCDRTNRKLSLRSDNNQNMCIYRPPAIVVTQSSSHQTSLNNGSYITLVANNSSNKQIDALIDELDEETFL